MILLTIKKMTLIKPTLDLFVYDLREGLGQTDLQIQENSRVFQQKLPEDIRNFNEIDDNSFEPEYLLLLGEQRWSDFETDTHEGYYYPVRLSDVYGLLVDCTLKAPQSTSDLQWLSDLKSYLSDDLLKGKTGNIGQTWMFSAQLSDMQEAETLKQRCYEVLADQNNHVIINFYPDETAARTAASKFYTQWMRLFNYYHKILWAYRQSRNLKQALKQDAVEIQVCLNESNFSTVDLNNLRKTLMRAWKIIPQYTSRLALLDDQSRTIEINLENYQKRLKKIKYEPTADQFLEHAREKYLTQCQKDYANFHPYLSSLENLIRSIQTLVAIEEEQRERNFQQKIAVWGITLAFAAIIASLSGLFPTTLETVFIAKEWIDVGIALGISIGTASIIGIGIWLWRR